MLPSKNRSLSVALAVASIVTPMLAVAQTNAPKTADECQSYAARQANEEYLSQRAANRENSPFARSPSGRPDPLMQSANQRADIDRTGRQQRLYDDCVAKLPK